LFSNCEYSLLCGGGLHFTFNCIEVASRNEQLNELDPKSTQKKPPKMSQTPASMADLTSKFKSGDILPTHEDTVRAMEEKVLSQAIPWEGYHRAN